MHGLTFNNGLCKLQFAGSGSKVVLEPTGGDSVNGLLCSCVSPWLCGLKIKNENE